MLVFLCFSCLLQCLYFCFIVSVPSKEQFFISKQNVLDLRRLNFAILINLFLLILGSGLFALCRKVLKFSIFHEDHLAQSQSKWFLVVNLIRFWNTLVPKMIYK